MKQLDPRSVWLFFFILIRDWIMRLLFCGYILIVLYIASINNTNTDDQYFKTIDWFLNIVINWLSSILNWIWIVIPALLFLLSLWAKLTYHYYRYELAGEGFRKEFGVIYKESVIIPYDRIQNVGIYHDIWTRILSLSNVNIQTAWTHDNIRFRSKECLSGLSGEVVEQLRNELIQRTQKAHHTGL